MGMMAVSSLTNDNRNRKLKPYWSYHYTIRPHSIFASENAADAYGFIRAELEAKEETIGANDPWIAAHALACGLTLVTNSEKEFRRVRGLKLRNWAGQAAKKSGSFCCPCSTILT
jgi:predicted nucleic acid-binding protein